MMRFRTGLGLGLLALLTLGCEDSTRLTYLPEPHTTRLEVSAERVKELEAKFPGKDGVYLDQSVDFEIVTSPALESVRARNYTYVVLNRNAERLSTFSVHVASGAELEKVFIQHRRPNGEQKEYGIADLKEERDSDGSRTYKFIYPNVEKGSVISEHYLVRHPFPRMGALMNFEAPLQWELPCENVRLRFLHPDSWEGQVKRLAADRTLPFNRTLDPNAHKAVYTYEAKDVAGLDEEPFAPFFKEMSNYFQFTFQSMPTYQYRGSLNWQEFQRDFSHYAVDKEAIISQRVMNTTTDLVKNCTTEEQKLDAVITWLQDNITQGPLPNNPNFADMLAAKHANPYQCTGLAKSMLGKAGIQASYVLMHSQQDGFFDEGFITFGEISWPGLKVNLGGKVYVVFPWAKGLPITHLPETFQGSVALTVGPDAPAGAFTKLPEGNLAANTWEERYDVVLDADGRATVKEEKVLTGSSAYGIRQSLKDLGKEETEKLLKKLLTYSEGEVKFTSVGFEHKDEPKEPLVIKLAYTVDNLVALTPEEVVFNTGGLFAPASSLKTKVDLKERHSPIRIHYDEARTKKVTLTFPAAWKLDTTIKDQSVENAFGSLAMTISSEKGRLQVDQTLRFKKASAEAKRFEDLLSLTGRRSQMAIPTLVFKIQG